MDQHIDIVFDEPPGPKSGRFVEVEDANGNSIRFGEWIERDDERKKVAQSMGQRGGKGRRAD